MLTTRERIEPSAAFADLQSDSRYGSAARQMHLYLDLAYEDGCSTARIKWLAGRLGIDGETVSYNNGVLVRAGLIKIDRKAGPAGANKVYPLPQGGNRDKETFQAQK
jgi:DNA-binding MarR family transcriptional regulator